MTERTDAWGRTGPSCVCTLNCSDKYQLADVLSECFVEKVLPRFAHEPCVEVAITVRGRVLALTLVVDNDTTVHDVHSCTVAFSPSVLIKCSICSYHHTLTRTPHKWLKKTIHGIRRIVILFHHISNNNKTVLNSIWTVFKQYIFCFNTGQILFYHFWDRVDNYCFLFASRSTYKGLSAHFSVKSSKL